MNYDSELSKCLFCKLNTLYTKNLETKLDNKKSFVLCDPCYKKNITLSKSFCLNELLINKNDLNNIKCFKKNNQYLYLADDIYNFMENDNNYLSYKEEKLLQKYNKISNITILRKNRKKQLEDILAQNKLDYKNWGDCFTYVQFGYPSIETVIQNELERCHQIFIRELSNKSDLNKSDIDSDKDFILSFN
jgi:hypothetical protein